MPYEHACSNICCLLRTALVYRRTKWQAGSQDNQCVKGFTHTTKSDTYVYTEYGEFPEHTARKNRMLRSSGLMLKQVGSFTHVDELDGKLMLLIDLSSLFTWNTKQLFVYMVAEYTNEKGVSTRLPACLTQI